VLVGAAAAFQKDGTGGGNPMRGRHGDFQQIGLQQTRLHLADTDPNLLPVKDPRHEAGHPVDTADPLPAKGDVMDFEFQFLAWTDGDGGIGLGHSVSLDGRGGAGQNKKDVFR